MVKLKDTKLTADIDDQTEEYVTFWGKIKGNIAKQEDLMDLINSAKVSLSSSIESLRTWFKKELKNLKTSDLENDGEGAQDSEGNIDKFTTISEVNNIADTLNAKVEDVEFELNDKIYDLNSEVNTKQEKLTAGDGIIIEQNSEGKNIISVQMGSMPGEGNLTVKLNGTTIVEFSANEKEDREANIIIPVLPNPEPRWRGMVLGLTDSNDPTYTFYDIPEELPEIIDASYEGAVLKVVNGKPEWVKE